MRYYHGTKSDFSEFTRPGNGKHGEGFYFTADRNEAAHFAATLAGDGTGKTQKVFTVNINTANLFNTNSEEHCQRVCENLGLKYRKPRKVGSYGAQEHYDYLEKQLRAEGQGNVNQAILAAGFDGLIYDFMSHVVIFRSEFIQIESVEPIV